MVPTVRDHWLHPLEFRKMESSGVSRGDKFSKDSEISPRCVQSNARKSRDSLLEELVDQPVVELLALLHGGLDAASIWLTRYSAS